MMRAHKSNFRWVIIALLFFITVVNYIDRASISYAIHFIASTFNLNDDEIGLILGAFGIGYLLTTLLGGIWVDRYGSKTTLLFAVLFWSVSMFFISFSSGFAMLFISRIMLGVAEGPNFPALTRTVSDWLNIRERTRALSNTLIAVPIGLAIGAPVISQLIMHFSWRAMFFILGGISLCWIPLWLLFFSNSPKDSKYVNDKELNYITNAHPTTLTTEELFEKRKTLPGLWKFLFSDRTLLCNYWAFFIFGYYLFFFMNWLPSYLLQRYGLQFGAVGLFTILPWALGAVMMWCGGIVADKIYIKTNDFRASRSMLILISQLGAGLCVIPVILAHTLMVTIIFISLAVGFILSANGAYYAVNIDIAKERSGTALGIMDACFALSGFLAPVLTGWLVTLTGNFNMAFALLSILTASSVILIILFHRPKTNPIYA